MSLSRGISSDMFLRLCTRAPWIAIVVRAAVLAVAVAVLELIRHFPHVDERHLLHDDIASLGELDRYRRFPDESLVREVFARRSHTLHIEVALEIILNLGR